MFDPLAQLPDERFFDAAEAVLHALDHLWLNVGAVSDNMAVSIREGLAQRLVATSSWRHLISKRSAGTGLHIAGAIAAVFMGRHHIRQGPRCYVHPLGAARTDSLLPTLTQLAEQAAGSTFAAIAFLGLLEVGLHANRLTFIARAAAAWWRVQGANSEFWIDYGIGRRLSEWIDKAVLGAPVSPTVLDSLELTAIVDILMQCGTPLASGLEERIAARRKAGAG